MWQYYSKVVCCYGLCNLNLGSARAPFALRLGQADLALKLGLSQSRIAAIERNPAAVSAGQLLEILGVLGVDLVLRDTSSVACDTAAQSNTSATSSQGEW
jgi:HTH-type transcriptional regulator/antitoxin HipB